MKFLIIGWGAPGRISGGMDVHVLNVAESLAKKGHTINVFVAGRASSAKTHKNINFLEINIAPNSTSTEGFVRIVEEYNKKIILASKHIDFDVILSHDWIGVSAAKNLKESTKKPWIHTVHSLEYMRSLQEQPHKSSIETLEKNGILLADEVIAVSAFMKNKISKKYSISAGVIYNGPSFDKPETTPGKTPTTPVILYVGRLTAQKGIEYLILASKRILEKHPKAKFIVAGEGDLKDPLESFAHALGVYPSFDFKGFVPKKELAELYAKSSVFVSPSIYEPFGITILDAVLFSCPVVATKNTGALELFGCEVTAVTKSDSNALASAIASVLEQPIVFEKKAEAAKKIIGKKDLWMDAARTIEKLCLLAQHKIKPL